MFFLTSHSADNVGYQSGGWSLISVTDGFQAITNKTVTLREHSYAEKTYGDINDLVLSAGQIKYVTELASTGTEVIVMLVGGRPRLLGELPNNVRVVINAMLPCELWEFGHGLRYTEFKYFASTLSRTSVTSITERVDMSVVKNPSSVAGKETVLLFLTQCSAPSRSLK
ncbi:hypothetical protein PR001_g32636 [Phytophthora rubi]|uniref:Glycoside hydrolase family 3 C-terminal domain-containing protein n=1 Tax=Phytophthora rubi TaxID=129364 RepID=A0A6A3G6I3_9STRA|nr:hypothetical protein PR001_g32636 [Phytophthora rubi]